MVKLNLTAKKSFLIKITHSGRQTVSLQTLANGVYHFRLSGKQTGVSVKKMVVMRE